VEFQPPARPPAAARRVARPPWPAAPKGKPRRRCPTGKDKSAAAAAWLITRIGQRDSRMLGIAVEATATAGEALAKPRCCSNVPPGLGKTTHGPGDRRGVGVRCRITSGRRPWSAPRRHRRPAGFNLQPPDCFVTSMRSNPLKRVAAQSCSMRRPWRTTRLDPPLPPGSTARHPARCLWRVSPGGEPPQGRRLELTGA